MKSPISILVFLFLFNYLNAQVDSLSIYSLAQLDSLYKTKKKPQERLPYALALLQKGEKELNTQDTSYAKLLFKIGDTYQNLRDFPNATHYLSKAIDIQKVKAPKHIDYVNSLISLGMLNYVQKNYAKTLELWLKALEIRKELFGEKHIQYVSSLNYLAILYWEMGDYVQSESLYLQTIRLYKEILGESHPDYASSLVGLGNLYNTLGSYSLAKPLYLQALGIQKKTLSEKHPNYAKSLNNLAALYKDMGNYSLAEPLYIQAINIKKDVLGDKHAEYAVSLNNLAILYANMGNYSLAESLSIQAMNIFKETFGETHPNYAISLNTLANLYNSMDKDSLAETLQRKSLNIRKETLGEKNPEYALGLNNLGILYNKMGNYPLAESTFLQAINIQKEVLGEKHPDYALILNNLAILYKSIKNYDKAESLYIQAKDIIKETLGENHPEYAQTLKNLGLLYSIIGSYDRAQSCYNQLLTQHLYYLELQGNTLGEKAKQNLFNIVAPAIYDVNYFAAFHRQHDSLLVSVQNGLLFTKGYALAGVSELLPLIKNLNDSTLNSIYITWTATKNQLGRAYQMSIAERNRKGINIDSLQRLASDQEAMLMRSSALLKERLGYNKKRFYYYDLKENIGKDEVLIDFVRFENIKKDTAWYYALVSQHGWQFPKYIPLCIESQLEPYASAHIRPNQESYITKNDHNTIVYNLIIRPLEPYLKKKKIIHWSPVALMNQIALGVLKNDKGKMLSERMEIHQYGSLKDFIIKKQTLGSTGSIDKEVLLVGDIAFDLEATEHINLAENAKYENLYVSRSILSDSTRGSNRFVPLKGTKVEIENLNKAFSNKKWMIQQLQQKDALEENVREYASDKTPSVMHFATHGFFIPAKKTTQDTPLLRSGIALAGANRVWMGKPQLEGVEDGLWTAYEIANANLLQADLVVLSACETAKGQIDPHEGVLGLQRSFKIAGVENMLLSLWQVPDKETVELMEEFYKYYLNGEKPATALRKAQTTMSKKYKNPYYWAAFILIE